LLSILGLAQTAPLQPALPDNKVIRDSPGSRTEVGAAGCASDPAVAVQGHPGRGDHAEWMPPQANENARGG